MTKHLTVGLGVLVILGACLQSQAQSSLASPDQKQDGWVTAAPESAGIAAQPLHDMEAAIRAGDFKKIGSVVVARHGKLGTKAISMAMAAHFGIRVRLPRASPTRW